MSAATPPPISPRICTVVEDLDCYYPLRLGDVRFEEPGYTLTMCGVPSPRANGVQRVRLQAEEVPAAVAAVREKLRAHGRPSVLWEIGPSATPVDLAERLIANGLHVYAGWPLCTAMAIESAPPIQPSPHVRIERVRTREQFTAGHDVMWQSFEYHAKDVASEMERAWQMFESAPRWRRYLAYVGDKVVACADGNFLPEGVALCGGATLPAARGQGAYQALLLARWEDAVACGTPALMTQAGKMSRPILAKLGFTATAEIRIYQDVL